MARNAGSIPLVGVEEIGRVTLDMVITELRVLSTSDRLLGLYELGLDACITRNGEDLRTVIEELIGALDFEYADIAEGFERLYTHCLDQARDGNFDSVTFILRDLRDTLARLAAELEDLGTAATGA